MKGLRRYLDKIKPNFEKGGKFSKLHSTFDAFETFLFVPNTVTSKGSHIRDAIDSKRAMSVVVFALMPALLFGAWNIGYQHDLALGITGGGIFSQFLYGIIKILPIIIVSYVVGLGVEFYFAQIRGHEVNEGFLVSGMLIPLVMPIGVPLWIVGVATVFAVVFGKEVFGGTGMNIVNPALLARAFIFFAYPSDISGNSVWTSLDGAKAVDGFSGATALGEAAANATNSMENIPSLLDSFIGIIPGSIGETSTLAILLGGIILLFTGVANWRVMLSVFIGGIAMSFLFNAFAGENQFMAMSPWHQISLGGFAFGAVFMATDPVTATQTNKGKFIYGFFIGFIAIMVRVLNPAYPEGMMMAILFMNVMAPLIDFYVIEANIKKRLKRAKVKN